MNQHIDSLRFKAKTLDGQHTIHLRFLDIRNIHTADHPFDFCDGLCEPVTCQYDSLQLLVPMQ